MKKIVCKTQMTCHDVWGIQSELEKPGSKLVKFHFGFIEWRDQDYLAVELVVFVNYSTFFFSKTLTL